MRQESASRPASTARKGLRGEILRLTQALGRPVGAYEIMATLRGDGRGSNIYRSLHQLIDDGALVRIVALRRYWAVPPDAPVSAILFVCRDCARIEILDAHDLAAALGYVPEAKGFSARTVEIAGRCRRCRGARAHDVARSHGERR